MRSRMGASLSKPTKNSGSLVSPELEEVPGDEHQ